MSLDLEWESDSGRTWYCRHEDQDVSVSCEGLRSKWGRRAMSNTCATCRWYTPMPNEGSDHGDCEMTEGEDRDVLGDDGCDDYEALNVSYQWKQALDAVIRSLNEGNHPAHSKEVCALLSELGYERCVSCAECGDNPYIGRREEMHVAEDPDFGSGYLCDDCYYGGGEYD